MLNNPRKCYTLNAETPVQNIWETSESRVDIKLLIYVYNINQYIVFHDYLYK